MIMSAGGWLLYLVLVDGNRLYQIDTFIIKLGGGCIRGVATRNPIKVVICQRKTFEKYNKASTYSRDETAV
jgi:hypothetical protein